MPDTTPTAALVEIATFNLLSEAEVARSVLESDGVPCVVQDRGFAAALPPVALTTGGVRLLVAEEDAERARALLEVPERILEDGEADPTPST